MLLGSYDDDLLVGDDGEVLLDNPPNNLPQKRSALIFTPSQLSRAGRTSRKNEKLLELGPWL
jgi:hypothetical protein